MLASAKKLFRQLTPRRRALAAAAVALAVVASFASLDEWVNRSLFLDPAARLQRKLGLIKALDKRVYVVTADDISLAKLGRLPTFADWSKIADLLFAAGYERALLLSVHGLAAEVGAPQARRNPGLMFGTSIVSGEGRNARTRPLPEVAAGMLLHGAFPARSGELFAYVPNAKVVSRLDGLFHLNILDGNRVELFMPVGAALALPHAAARAVPVPPAGGWSTASFGARDGVVRMRPVDPDSVFARSVQAAAFFGADGEVRGEMVPKLADRVAGGKVALLVTDGFTGSRSLETPFGLFFGYVAVANLVDNALNHAFLSQPVDPRLIVLATLALACAFLAIRRPRAYGAANAAALAVVVAAGVALRFGPGIELPVASCVFALCGLYLVRSAFDVLGLAAEKLSLRRDLEVGQTVQRVLLPKQAEFAACGWQVSFIYRPYGLMAGDWYQSHVHEDAADPARSFAVVAIGDVVGKGPSAALNTALIAGLWNDWRGRWRPDEACLLEFMDALDRFIAGTFAGEQNTTISLALLTPERALLACAGSPPWIDLARGQEVIRHKTAPRNPLGITRAPNAVERKRSSRAVAAVAAASTDMLFAYTDGVVDGWTASKGLVDALNRGREGGATLATAAVVDIATACGKDQVFPDDFTMILFSPLAAAKDLAA